MDCVVTFLYMYFYDVLFQFFAIIIPVGFVILLHVSYCNRYDASSSLIMVWVNNIYRKEKLTQGLRDSRSVTVLKAGDVTLSL